MEEININPYKQHLNLYIEEKLKSVPNENTSQEKKQGVSVITCTNRFNKINDIFNNFLRQRYMDKELIIILNNDDIPLDEYLERAKGFNNIKVFKLDENLTLGDCFKFALEHAIFDYIAKFDDDDYYGSYYLIQAMETFEEQSCDVIGKASYYIYFHQSKTLAIYAEQKQNKFISRVADSSLVFKREIFEKVRIPTIKKAGTFAMLQTNLKKHGIKIYSTDKYNYLVNRYDDLEHNHTWKVSDEEYLNYKLTKIVEENVTDFTSYVEKER
jgi:hypothetical protein